MADIATAVISGTFAVFSSFGSVWLKDHLEQRRQSPSSRSGALDATPSSTVVILPDAPTVGSRLRPLFVTLFGFVVGIVSSFIYPMFTGPSHPEAMVSFGLLALAVLSSIAHHAKVAPGRGLAVLELETLSLWAAYAFGWSLVHGSLWSELLVACNN